MHRTIHFALELIAWLVAFAWLSRALATARGLRRIPDLTQTSYDLNPTGNPSLTVIVPARNEAAGVAACLTSLLQQDYSNLQIIAIDDRSTDATGAIMDSLAAQHPTHLRILHITTLPDGWLGKTHAMALAARDAISLYSPDFLLFTDADILFAPQSIRISLAQAIKTNADHFVTLPTPILKSPGEGMLLGYLQVMGLWAARPWRVEDPKALRDAIGIGAFNLLRTPAYQQLGGFEALRLVILEDLTLARNVKLAGLRQRLAYAPGYVSLHWAPGALGIVKVMTKNLFAVFAFRPAALLAAALAISGLCLSPFLFLITPGLLAPGLIAVASVFWMFALATRRSGIPFLYALAFPLSTALFVYSLLRSMLTTLKDGGVTWRGTFYPLANLRKSTKPLR